jgi:hypothetical protein
MLKHESGCSAVYSDTTMTAHRAAIVTVGLRLPLAAVQATTYAPEAGKVRVRVRWAASAPLDLRQNDEGVCL